jgi:acyl-CoA thioesterase I
MYFRSLRLMCGILGVLVAASLFSPAFAGSARTMSDSARLLHVIERMAAHQLVRIIAFGSSSTEGVGASSPSATYPSRLQVVLTAAWASRLPVVVLNRGVGGEDADDMARRLPTVIAEHPDLIIWQTGSNDPLRGVPLARFEQETTAGIDEIRAAHIDVMLLEPQLCRELENKPVSVEYRDALRAIGEAMDVTVIRRYDLMRQWVADGVLTPEQMLSPDGLHMADGGYAKLADAIADDIRQATEPRRVAMDALSHH